MTSETAEIQICGRYLALSTVSHSGFIRSDYYSSAGRSTTELTNYSLFQLDESGNILTDGCYYPSGQIWNPPDISRNYQVLEISGGF